MIFKVAKISASLQYSDSYFHHESAHTKLRTFHLSPRSFCCFMIVTFFWHRNLSSNTAVLMHQRNGNEGNVLLFFAHCLLPAQKQKLSGETQAPHGHQQTSHCHAFAEAGYHPGLGQMASELFQQLVEALLPSIAVDFVRVGDANPFLG